jgi:hypothetical protein
VQQSKPVRFGWAVDRGTRDGTHILRLSLMPWEGVAVYRLQFEVTVAVVLTFVVLLGAVVIGLLQASTM